MATNNWVPHRNGVIGFDLGHGVALDVVGCLVASPSWAGLVMAGGGFLLLVTADD